MLTEEQREVLLDILDNTESLDKISIHLDHITHAVAILIEDLDDEWFRELRDSLPTRRNHEEES